MDSPAPPLYGPPPDPRQVLVDTSLLAHPGPWIACIAVGVGLAAWAGPRRVLPFVAGLTVALTAPLAWYLPTYVYGAFPTIDKAGSLLFYLDGVHTRLFHPDDPALRLIGVHVGHLWITAAFDLVLEPFAAFTAQGLLNLVLAWATATWFLHRLCGRRAVALLLAFPFAMNLHQFRDLNWYTIEKTSIFWLPTYGLALLHAGRNPAGREPPPPRRAALLLPAAALFGAFFTNIYLGMLCSLLGAWRFLVGSPRERLAVVISAIAPLPLVAYQWRLMHGAASLATPEQFLTERAVLDVVELFPPRWNRLEGWRAVNLVALGLGLLGARRPAARSWLALAAIALVISLGPAHNPLYLLLFEAVPGFWRVAKPETFFHLAWLCLLASAAIELTARHPRDRALMALAALFAGGWVAGVRMHAVFPQFSLPVAVHLADDWQQALPPTDNDPR